MTLHNTEVQFYTNIQHEKIDLFLPRIFHSVCATCATADELEDSFVLMEDLTRKAGHANVLEGLTKGQVESAIKAVAKFHAHSLKMPPDMVQKLAQSQAMTNGYPSMVNGHSDLAPDKDRLLKRLLALPFEYFRQHEKALRNLFSTAKTPNYDDMLKHYGIPPVLGHGEFWAANIFFAKDPHEQVTDEVYALFDWQTPKLGAGIADVGLLILTSTNSNLKLRYLDDWLALYHETFVQYVRTYKLKVLCTLEQIREMFYFYYPSLTVSVLEHVMRLYDEATDIKVQTALMGRMISTFEMIRKDFEGDDLDAQRRAKLFGKKPGTIEAEERLVPQGNARRYTG
ncbi:hypothetical protein AAVH_35665 [Aphelenchoides avenae]|nr:hypothetical protein AAVH_35665 [Aphelenchus avenae]